MTRSQRIAYGCGQLGVMALARFFFSWNLKYADQRSPAGELLLDAALVGLAFFVARIFDGAIDPLIGWVSDRWSARGHERRTLLWSCFAAPSIALVMLFAPTHDWPVVARWLVLVAGMLVFFAGYSFYAIPYWSLVDDYAGEDVRERGVLSNLLGAGLLLATAVVGVLSPLAVQRLGYASAAWLFAAPAALLMLLPIVVHPPARARAATSGSQAGLAELWRGLGKALRHRRFVAALCLYSGAQMAFTVITAAAPFIAEHLLGGSERDVARLMGPFLATALPCFLFAPALSRRLGWQRAMALSVVGLAVVYGGTAGLGEALLGTPMTTAMVLFGLGGPMAAIILGLEGEAVVDCAREQGGGVVSLYFGVFNFLVQVLNGLAAFLTGLLVSLSHDPEVGVLAVRAMGLMAAGLLLLGLGGYGLLRRGSERAPS